MGGTNRIRHVRLRDDWRLAGTDATSSSTATTLVPMTILGFSADESLINLDDATKFSNVLHKSGSDLVAHEPCGFIRTEAHVAADLQSAHSLLTGEHQVDDLEPVAEIDFGVLENGPRYVREAIGRVRGTSIAMPFEGHRTDGKDPHIATARAMHTLGPSLANQIGAAGFLIRERLIE